MVGFIAFLAESLLHVVCLWLYHTPDFTDRSEFDALALQMLRFQLLLLEHHRLRVVQV
jgi:hypothetical protein